MELTLFFVAALLYAASFALELIRQLRSNPNVDAWLGRTEVFGFIIFTAGIVLFVMKSQFGYSTDLRKSIGWLFFAWSLASANLLTYLLYDNRATGIFSKGWVIAAILFLPYMQSNQFVDYFSSTLSWLNFHRIVFLFGYAFYLLGLPLAANFLWKDVIQPYFGEIKDGLIEHHLQELDGLHQKMILWALPLLSLGLLTKILLLVENEPLVTPQIILQTSKEEILPIITWFTCALYLHTRIFLRWRYNACAFVYIAGLAIVIAAHYSGQFLLQITQMLPLPTFSECIAQLCIAPFYFS